MGLVVGLGATAFAGGDDDSSGREGRVAGPDGGRAATVPTIAFAGDDEDTTAGEGRVAGPAGGRAAMVPTIGFAEPGAAVGAIWQFTGTVGPVITFATGT